MVLVKEFRRMMWMYLVMLREQTESGREVMMVWIMLADLCERIGYM